MNEKEGVVKAFIMEIIVEMNNPVIEKQTKAVPLNYSKETLNDNFFRNVAKYFEVPLCRFVCFLTTNTHKISLSLSVTFIFKYRGVLSLHFHSISEQYAPCLFT